MADDTGLAPKESVIETLCGFPDGASCGGFRVSAEILLVRLRRGRPLDASRDAAGRLLPGIPYCICLCSCFCHCASPVLPVLVRQLRGPHLRT